MDETLYTPDRERVITTNAWAFMHWLRTVRGVNVADWAGLQRWSASAPIPFCDAVTAFAGLATDAPSSLVCGAAEALLHADLRPDDRAVVLGAVWPWLAARAEGTTLVQAEGDPLAAVARERASVLIVPAQTLAEAAFQHRRRPDIPSLRTIIATGGPLSPEGRRRIYIWVKADVMLLARSGDTFWGNPLEPVFARPLATPAFLTRSVATPAIR